MNQQPFSLPAELDARNRAALYLNNANEAFDQRQQQADQQRTGEFLLWLKNLDQSHAMEIRKAEHRHALELEDKKLHSTVELRKLEVTSTGNLRGAPSSTSYETGPIFKLVISALAVILPILLPVILSELTNRKRSHANNRHPRRRKLFLKGRQRWK